MARYVMTARRKAALRKAQLASARKRKGKGKFSAKNRRRAKAVGGAVAVGAMMYASYRLKSGRAFHKATSKDHSARTSRAVASRMRLDDAVSNAEKTLARTSRRRGGPPRSQSLEAAGNAFLTQARWKVKPPKPRKGGAPSSRSEKAGSARIHFDHARIKPGLRRDNAMWKAKKKRGLFKTAHSKAKYRRRNEAKRKKKG